MVVVSSQSVPGTVLSLPSLAPGATAPFAASFTAPADACSASSTVSATAADACSGLRVTNTAAATCPLATAPRLAVTKDCPAQPVAIGEALRFSGTVTNTGNVTLTNVLVVNSQPAPNTPVFGPVTLAPGAGAGFSGSYPTPADACAVTDTLLASGQDQCSGQPATDSVSATCALQAAPAIAVTQACPTTPVVQGGLLTYSGTVSNAGDITLTNIVVVNNWPAPNTVVFTALSLAPGAMTNFTGSFLVPANCCVAWSTVQARGRGCDGVLVADTDSGTCAVLTAPGLVVTKVCPPTAVRPGEMLYYSGTVSNVGNIALFNVTVMNTQPGADSLLLGNLTLAPGESISYATTYVVPSDFCGTDTVTARGLDACTYAPVISRVTTTCSIAPYRPRIAVTKHCPPTPTPHGGELIFSGTVSNPGNVTLVNVFVVNNQPSNNTPVLGPITLAPGASFEFTGSYTAPSLCCEIIDTLTARGQDHCTGSNVVATATAVCPLLYTPGIAVVQNCPPNPLPMGSVYKFTGFVTNTGDAILTNVVVFSSQAGQNLPLLGPLDLAPGESEQYTGSLTVPFNTCAVTVTATSQETCKGTWITNTTACPVAATPRLALTQDCPVNPVSPGGLLTFSGSVSNAGNITVTNVVVLNNRSGAAPVFTVAALAPGEAADFTGSYVAPADCASTSASTATGRSLCGAAVTNTVSVTCPILTTPLLALTQDCPANPASPGGLLTYSGSVSNAGNITLNNLVVTNSQSGNTPLLTLATLAPGAAANFTGSYVAPATGPATSTSTARAVSLCGAAVTNTASSACSILTTPGIAVTKHCPLPPVAPGGTLVFTGTVTNTGDVTLTNVLVVNSQPAPATPVLGPITLAPGAGTNFTGSYLVPLDACSAADTLTATGQDANTGLTMTDTASAICALDTTPGIAITQSCPPGPVSAGSSVEFGGLVSNTGKITLTNILVFSGQPAPNTPVLGPITLAPGASAPFTGSYITSGGSNPTTNSTLATNTSNTITTNVVSVIATNNTMTVTTNAVAPMFGTLDPVGATLADRFNVVDNLHGLTFADQEQQWGTTLFYSTRHPGSGADTFDTISTIAPLAGVVTSRFDLSSTNYDALTLAAPDVGYGAVNFYYVRHTNSDSGGSMFGVIKAAGASSSADLWPLAGTGYNALAFAEANLGYGANMFYFLRQDDAGHSIFGTINPTPGGSALDQYAVGTNFDALVFVPGAVSDWGTGIFAYLRHDEIGSIIGTIDPVTHAVTDRLSLGANFLSALTFTATDVGYGPNLFYHLRPEKSILTTNTVTIFTTNTVTTFTTNTVITYTTNSVVSFTPTNTVTATGLDICQARTVAAAADCFGSVTPAAQSVGTVPPLVPVIGAPTMANGFFSLSFPTENGKSYTVQYKNALNDPTWTDLATGVGTGENLPITDPTAAQQPRRFYRVMFTP